MKLWRLTLRRLSLIESERAPFNLNVICRATCELDLMNHLYFNKFTPEWWSKHLTLEIYGPSDIWHMEETSK